MDNQQPSMHFAAYYRWLVLVHHLNIKIRAKSILDVGCDDGSFLAHQVGQLRVGVDLDPRVPPDRDFSVVLADGCALPFVDGSFECVLAFDVIEHALDDRAFVASVTRVLAQSGQLWLSTPTDTPRIFPSWLTRRAMKGWGHERVGYNVDDLVSRFPPGFHVEATLWNAASFRFLFVLLRLLRILSPALARGGARLCFALDRHLPQGHDYMVLRAVRVSGQERVLPEQEHPGGDREHFSGEKQV